jgi:hypothetical protein
MYVTLDYLVPMGVEPMRRALITLLLFSLTIVGAHAQAPTGWKLRIDQSTSATDPDAAGRVKFTTSGSGFHAVNPQAATYWNPANRATGTYALKANFTLLEPSNHTNYYGLVFGGSGLEGGSQRYIYFMVAQDGTWLLKQRMGENTPTIARGTSAAVKKPDATGKSTNAVEVRVMADKIDFVVNGSTVHSMPKSGALASTDGTYGFRVNHFLNVQVDQLAVSKS